MNKYELTESFIKKNSSRTSSENLSLRGSRNYWSFTGENTTCVRKCFKLHHFYYTTAVSDTWFLYHSWEIFEKFRNSSWAVEKPFIRDSCRIVKMMQMENLSNEDVESLVTADEWLAIFSEMEISASYTFRSKVCPKSKAFFSFESFPWTVASMQAVFREKFRQISIPYH